MNHLLRALCVVSTVLALGTTPGHSQDFYKGKTVTIISGGSGGYDAYARVLSRHMKNHIPGEPTMVVKGMPAASSMVAANHIYNVAEPDGLTIGGVLRQIALAPLMGDPAVMYQADKFVWLGTSSSYLDDTNMLWVRKELGIKTIDDLRAMKKPLQIGSTGRTSTGDEGSRVIAQVLGLNIKIIRGYDTSPAIMLAMERGELDATMIGVSSLSSTKPEWLKPDGPVTPLLQFGYGGAGRHPLMPNVPKIDELVSKPEDKAVFYLLQVPFKLARPFLAPPGLPADKAAILKTAFMNTHQDPNYLEEAKKMNLDVSPLTGDEVVQLIRDAEALPKSLVDRYQEILKVE